MRRPRHHHTYEEYLYFEEYVARYKNEYIDGDILAMTGGSPDHARITANVISALNIQLRGKKCSVFSSDLRIRIEVPNVATYPDVSVVCGQAEADPRDAKKYGVLNPVVICEVLSPTTAEYDCGEKLEYYKMIPALREILFVDYAQRRLAIWRRGASDAWALEEISAGEVTFASIGCTLSIDDVYRDPLAS